MRAPLLLALVSFAGCGAGPSATSPLLLTCDLRDTPGAAAPGECQEWRGDASASTNVNVDFAALCTATLNGTVLAGPCPPGAVGVCSKRPSVAERIVLHRYYSPDWDAARASTACTSMGGSWSPT
jgi:hypothetical protein